MLWEVMVVLSTLMTTAIISVVALDLISVVVLVLSLLSSSQWHFNFSVLDQNIKTKQLYFLLMSNVNL